MFRLYLVASLNVAVLVLGLGLVEGALAVVIRHPVLVFVWLGRELLLFVGGGGGLIGPGWGRRGGCLVSRLGGDINWRTVRPGGGGHSPEEEKILQERSESIDTWREILP